MSANVFETRLKELAWPSVKAEAYRFLPLREFRLDSLMSEPARARLDAKWADLSMSGSEAALVVVGELAGECVIRRDASLPEKVVIEPVDLNRKLPEAFLDDRFAQFAAARARNGVRVFVPAGVKLDRPIRVVNVASGAGASARRNVMEIGERAVASLIEEWQSDAPGDHALQTHLQVTELVAGAHSKVRYAPVQGFERETQFFLRHAFEMREGADFECVGLAYGGKRGQTRIDGRILGRDVNYRIFAASRGDRDQVFDYWTDTHHLAPDSKSALDYWTVMADQAKAVFNSGVSIPKHAVRTDATQKNRNMLLSPKAVIDTLPKLEIATDEVKCAHGASVSPVNPEQLHYLMSRGIARNEAQAMIIDGFTEPVISRLPDEALRARVQERLAEKRGAS